MKQKKNFIIFVLIFSMLLTMNANNTVKVENIEKIEK